MESSLEALEALAPIHGQCGTALFEACESTLYPCDALAFVVLDRSLNLVKGFALLMRNGGYTCGMALLRMQLDSVLRFYGVATSSDPHQVADDMLNGAHLRDIKDADGKKMTDARLRERLAIANPQINSVYELTSGYIHLSEHHFAH